jgi:hypothetical protein
LKGDEIAKKNDHEHKSRCAKYNTLILEHEALWLSVISAVTVLQDIVFIQSSQQCKSSSTIDYSDHVTLVAGWATLCGLIWGNEPTGFIDITFGAGKLHVSRFLGSGATSNVY